MKNLAEHSTLFAAVLYFFLMFHDRFAAAAFTIALCFWLIRTRNRSVLIAAVLLGLTWLRISLPAQRISEGRVVSVSTHSAVVRKGLYSVVLYCAETPVLDSKISFHGDYETITGQKGFWAFNTAGWYGDRGIRLSCRGEYTVVRESRSLRGLIQRKIMRMEEPEQSIMARILLGLTADETTLRSSLRNTGFSLSGVLMVLDAMLKRVLLPEKRRKVMNGICLGLNLLYHFPPILLQNLIFRLLAEVEIPASVRTGCGLSVMLLLQPHVWRSAAFVLPAVFRLSALSGRRRKKVNLYSLTAQSLLFKSMNPLGSYLYGGLLKAGGFVWLSAFGRLFLPFIPVVSAAGILDRVYSVMDFFTLPGSILGAGLPFFLLLLFSLRQSTRRELYAVILLLGFQITGLFHPFAEVSFINVGQGDAILIRMPFNRENIMIDTGKPSQQRTVETFLQAKGIRRIHALFITHDDSDHSGNAEYIAEVYKPKFIITEHQGLWQGRFTDLLDLSHISDDDLNHSSLMLYGEFNGLEYLFTGDADEEAERTVIREYNDLQCDVLKLSHHGSNTGSCSEFLDQVQPVLGIVSCGAYSVYHHPDRDVIQRLMARRIRYLSTREDGDITVLMFAGINLVITASGKIVIMNP